MEGLDLARSFGGAYRGRRVLVTGHTGFKGSWLVAWLRELGAQPIGLALPPEGSPNHWQLLGLDSQSVECDIRDAEGLRAAVSLAAPDVVFHLAAQALVRRSYREPVATVATNVMGLVNLFEAVRATPSVRVVVNATTDKCYENDGRRHGYVESDPLGGADPYSASKACAEVLSAAWRRSFMGPTHGGPLLATARAGNVIGGGDWAEDRIVPDLVRAAASGEVAEIRHPSATRPWQHVLEPLSGYLLLGQRLLAGDARAASAWNFGPDSGDHVTVEALCQLMQQHWTTLRYRVAATPATLHEAAYLSLDCSRAQRDLAWRPVWQAGRAVAQTSRWYAGYYGSGKVDSLRDIAEYVRDARAAGLEWAA